MTRLRLFLRMLFKAAWLRTDRSLTALISAAVVATIATASLTIYYDLENKLSHEFRGFGANVTATPRSGPVTPEQIKGITQQLEGKGEALPMTYVIATAPGDRRVVVGGTDLQALQRLNSWWSVREINSPPASALLGVRAAETLSPSGERFVVSVGTKKLEVLPNLVFTSGSRDDSLIYIDSSDFTKLSAAGPQTVLLRIVGPPREIQETIKTLSASLPELDIQPLRQITESQASVVGKTRAVVLASSAVVVILIMLCMGATFTSSVLERRKDFAVMKALGASNVTVNVLFAAEAALLALAGAVPGFIAGSGIAFWIGKVNFDAAILPQPALVLPVLVGSMCLALLASTAPLRLLQRIQPAGILRGE